jgi:predicted ATP-grasp superfamily ATP-dependent carboligase
MSEPEVLTIVGASARAASHSARRAGFSPCAADLFADVDLRGFCPSVLVSDYPQGLERACAGPQPGGWMYTGALENYPGLVDRLASIRALWGNGGAVLRAVRDPRRVADAVAADRASAPALAESSAGLPTDGSWLVKPYRSAGGANIRVWNADAPPSDSPDRSYFQQRVDGLVCSAVYVAARGSALLLGVTEQLVGVGWSGAPAFSYAGSIGPLALEAWQRKSFARLGERLAAAFGLVGLFGVDAVLTAEKLWILEVNPRYTASVEVLERALALGAVGLHVTACRDGALARADVARASTPAICAGKVIVYARRPVVVPEALALAIEPQLGATWPPYADVPAPGTEIRGGRPVLTLLSSGPTAKHVLSDLRERAARFETLLYG